MSSKRGTSKAIIIKLQGGLGNQLFQYALGRNLSLTRQAVVKYDLSWFGTQTKRKYDLGNYRVTVNFATSEKAAALQRCERKTGKLAFVHNLLYADDTVYIKERSFRFDPAILTTTPPAYLDGSWQSEKYFAEVADTIRRDFTLINPATGVNAEMLAAIRRTRAIAVHVRRGDYATDKTTKVFHGLTTLSYYQQALEKIQTIEPSSKIFVFSDDHAWVKSNLRFHLPTVFVDHNSPKSGHHEDLRLMAACRHQVIANSSFSWWGAWLNPHPQKVVIAPKKWFNDPTINTDDLLPASWITI